MKIDRVVVATAVTWLGLWVHELYRVPRLLGFTPDGDLFMLPIAAGLAFWWSRSRGAPAAWVLTVYAAVNLGGALMTVLPLDLQTFVPEQTVAHYAVHVIYAVCQFPLLTLAILHGPWRSGRAAAAGGLKTAGGPPRLATTLPDDETPIEVHTF